MDEPWPKLPPDTLASSSILQCKFPPFGVKSVHLSVNLPTRFDHANAKRFGQIACCRRKVRTGIPCSKTRSDPGPPLWREETRKREIHKGEQVPCKKSKKRTRKSLRSRRYTCWSPARNRRPKLPASWEWRTARCRSGVRILQHTAAMPFLAVGIRRRWRKKITI